jgi:hypothetical protein
MRQARHVVLVEKLRNEYKNLVGKPDGNRRLGRPMSIQDYDIKMDVKK